MEVVLEENFAVWIFKGDLENTEYEVGGVFEAGKALACLARTAERNGAKGMLKQALRLILVVGRGRKLSWKRGIKQRNVKGNTRAPA